MARQYLMSWKQKERRWRKLHRGIWYTVSCRQLGTPKTKEGSWRAANEWWKREQAKAESPAGDVDDKAEFVKALAEDFPELDEAKREKIADMAIEKGAYRRISQAAAAMVKSAKQPAPDKTIAANIDAWVKILYSACVAGQLSESRYHAYSRDILTFSNWVDPGTGIDRIGSATIEGYFNHLSAKVAAKEFAPATAHLHFVTAKQFISWLIERGDIVAPANLRSRRMKFNQGRAAKIETFTIDEIREILAACEESEERIKLYILLQINCGQYQGDLADMTQDEVDWENGVIRRARSKTKNRGGPVVSYRLWPETFHLLTKFRAKSGPLALTDEEGRPLVARWMEGDRMHKRDSVEPSWRKLARKMGKTNHRLSMKHLRKTAATILGSHPSFKYYSEFFLAHSPQGVANRHYVTPSDLEFAEALAWLRVEILGTEAK